MCSVKPKKPIDPSEDCMLWTYSKASYRGNNIMILAEVQSAGQKQEDIPFFKLDLLSH